MLVICATVCLTTTVDFMTNNLPPKKGVKMATSTATPVGKKSAEDEFLDSFDKVIDSAAEKMTNKEFLKRAKKAQSNLERSIASHSRRRGTA